MKSREELSKLWMSICNVRNLAQKLERYKGNRHYKKHLEDSFAQLNKEYKFLYHKVNKTNMLALREKFKKLDGPINSILAEKTTGAERLSLIKTIELFWPELELELENLKLNISNFEIPSEIPMTECRLDLEEAIKDYDNGCYLSSLVLCRRSYEGALVGLYRIKTQKEPLGSIKCRNCQFLLRDKAYIGIAKLHSWAIENKFVAEKLKQVGFLISDIAAGGAHPPLSDFPRDKEIAKLGITATITLLKEVYKK
jgi:hypothetical protein